MMRDSAGILVTLVKSGFWDEKRWKIGSVRAQSHRPLSSSPLFVSEVSTHNLPSKSSVTLA